MNHLTNEQFEDIMQGTQIEREHLDHCELCQSRLAEKRVLAERLRSAFENIEPDEELVQKIRRQLNIRSMPSDQAQVNSLWDLRSHWRGWTVAVSAAAALIVLVPILMYFAAPSSAVAAQAELVKIHEHNLSPGHEFYSEAEPTKLAEYFKGKLGFNPRLPELGHGMSLRGCCVRHFKGEVVGSYVVDTPRGIISVIVVTDTPKEIGMTHMPEKAGYEQSFWESSYAQCNMVTVRLGGHSYCAIGEISEISEISHKYLRDLLSRLMPEIQQ
jgi:hypothetical protein